MIRVVNGLQPATAYTFTIAAVTADGVGAAAKISATTKSACDGAALSADPSAVLSQPGGTVQVTTTLTNGCDTAMSNVRLSLTAPDGYQVTPAPPATVPDLQPGATQSVTWTVALPADAVPSAQLTHTATFTADNGNSESVTAASAIDVPADTLAALFDNVGVTDDTNTGVGDIDGAGSSLSAQAPAGAGVTPGATISHDGMAFTWPGVQSGQPDNVVAGGQALHVNASGSTLAFLTAATYGPASGTGRVIYADGTTQDYTLTAPDWYSTPAANADIAVTMPYRNRGGNVQQSHAIHLFVVQIPLQAKAVSTVVLPNISQGATSGVAAAHIFALSIGSSS
jgi:hypothetical protein